MHSAAALVGGNAVAQIIQLAAAPIKTRLFTPADFGALAVFANLAGIVALVSSGRYQGAVPRAADDARAIDIVVVCFILLLVVSAACCVGAALFGDWLISATRTPSLLGWLWLFPLAVLGAGLYDVLGYWATRQRLYGLIARTRLSQSVLGTAATLALGAAVAGPAGLLIGAVVSQVVGVLALTRNVGGTARAVAYRPSWTAAAATAREHFRFSVFATGSSLLNSAGLYVPPLLFAVFYGELVAGHFTLAQRVVLMPMTLIGAAVAQLFLGEGASLARGSAKELPMLFRRVTRRLLPLALLVIGCGLAAPAAFPVVFGKDWTVAGRYTLWLAIACAAQLVVSPISVIVLIRDKMGAQLLLDTGRALLVVGGLGACHVFGLSAESAVATYSLLMFGTYCVAYLVYRGLAAAEPAVPTTSTFEEALAEQGEITS